MIMLPKACQALLLPLASFAVLGLAFPGGARAQQQAPADAAPPADFQEPTAVSDPYLWLENVTGDKALDWVRARNAVTQAELAGTPEFKQLEAQILAILDSEAKIPYVRKIGDDYYNFWKDAQHPRGIWRRTTLEEYRTDSPQWETVIDLDALNAAEGENWVWHGADCLDPPGADQDPERCLISLSRGGADADVTREFDLGTQSWVEDGFFREEAKGGLGWIDRDHVYVYTDFGDGTLTESGYPRIVKRWTRGTPMSAAEVVYEGQPGDMYIAAYHDHTPGYERDFVSRTLAFYNDELYAVHGCTNAAGAGCAGAAQGNGELVQIDAPNSANNSVHKDWLVLELREPYTAGGRTWPAGSLIAGNFDDFMAGEREFTVLFEPSATTALTGRTWTKNHLVINVLDDVRNRLVVLAPPADGQGEWQREAFTGAPDGTLNVWAVDADHSDKVWLTSDGYLNPETLAIAELGEPPQVLKTMPSFFDASTHEVAQHFATSKDGTRIPYFIVKPKDLVLDGETPTLLYGYGGFEISLLPGYSGTVGKGWLEKGGVYAVANIRGGGEYGPRWHQAALKENRHKAYEDFAAVATDLIERGVTSPGHLGAMGGSNGGLLMGNMLTQYPQLFGAIVAQVPLLDMRRYHKLLAGASWMAEYGDPDDPEQWAFIKTFSPYHLYEPGKDYPPTLFMTSTRDDRVHPGHARKMMAMMLDAGEDVRYYENTEGGHGGAANNQQAAHMSALAYTFLWNQLTD